METTRRTVTRAAAAARAGMLAAALAILAGLSGCAGWSKEGRHPYLETLPVATPELSSIADSIYSGSHTLKLPPKGSRRVSSTTTWSAGRRA